MIQNMGLFRSVTLLATIAAADATVVSKGNEGWMVRRWRWMVVATAVADDGECLYGDWFLRYGKEERFSCLGSGF